MKKDKNKEAVADEAKAVPQKPQVDTLKQEDTETLQITLTKEEKDILYNSIFQIDALMRTCQAIAERYDDCSTTNWLDVITLMTVGQEKVLKIMDIFGGEGIEII